jgi:hypothetical protein
MSLLGIMALICAVVLVSVIAFLVIRTLRRIRREERLRIERQHVVCEAQRALRDNTHAALRQMNETVRRYYQP